VFANYVGILRSMVKSKLIYLIDALVFCATFASLDALLKLIEIKAYLTSTLSVKLSDSVMGQFTNLLLLISVVIGVLIAIRVHWLIEGKTLKNSKVELRIGWWYWLIGAALANPYCVFVLFKLDPFFFTPGNKYKYAIPFLVMAIPYLLLLGLYKLTIKQLTPKG